MNWPLFSVIYSMAATVTIGLFMIGALITGFDEIFHIQILNFVVYLQQKRGKLREHVVCSIKYQDLETELELRNYNHI